MSFIIKLHDRAFMGVRRLGCYEFYWEPRVTDSLQFVSKNHADLAMMTIRAMRPEMFPTCLPEDASVVEFEREYESAQRNRRDT